MEKSVAAALLMERTVRQTYEDRAPSAVQPLQWSILRFLKMATTADARISAIAKYLGTNHAPISRAVATLVKRGLVARKTGPESSRTSPIVLTPLGLETMENDPILKIASKIDSLPEDERQLLERVLTKLALDTSYEVN